MSTDLNFWENYYAKHQEPGAESPFSRFVMPFLKEKSTLYELGCGNGRDSVYFSNNGIEVDAFDQCENEIKYLNDTHGSNQIRLNLVISLILVI